MNTDTSGPPTSGKSPTAGNSVSSAYKDLLPRVVSGAVLAAGALVLTYWGLVPFAGLILVVSLILCWEWGGVIRGDGFDLILGVHGAAVALAIVLGAMDLPALGLLAVFVGAITIFGLRFGEKAHLSALGVFYVGLPALALLWFRGSVPNGFAAVVFLFAAIWATDIGAYAAGRAIGGPKLWPAVSPKKTWSGLLGGVLSGALAGTIWGIYSAAAPAMILAVTAILLALISQAGDMAESALKRRFDVKDSSSLIPGHGGFMDRVDGLIAAVIAAAVFAIVTNSAAPAKALLFWS